MDSFLSDHLQKFFWNLSQLNLNGTSCQKDLSELFYLSPNRFYMTQTFSQITGWEDGSEGSR